MTELSEVKKILQDHEKRISQLEALKEKPAKKQKETGTDRSRGDLLIELKNEGFFKEPRLIGEIADKLTEMNYYTKSSDLTLPLQKLVRSRVLRRVKKDRQWAYVASR